MKITHFLLTLAISFSTGILWSQQYAGEETSCCSSTGAVIGTPDPNPEHCYLWEIADGLTADQVNQTNPLVKPNETTTYRVTVTDQEFSFRAVDQVKVKVYFGGVQLNPAYALPDGEMNQVKATLTVNGLGGLPPDPFTWSIAADPDGTGCTINQDGWISGCNSPGKIKVRATNDDNPACIAEKEMEVNVGVRDLIVRDLTNAGREAKSNDTLYILASNNIEFEALPNEGTTFPQGQPEWSGDLSPPPGNDFLWSTTITEGTYVVTAGEKTVTVIRLDPNTVTVQRGFNLGKLQEYVNKWTGYTAAGLQSPLCTPIPVNFTLPTSITGGIKFERVGKYQNPDYGIKTELSLELPGLGVSGCAPILPCCGFIAGIPGGGSVVIFPYVRFSAGIGIQVNLSRDPSSENSGFIGGGNALTGKLELAAGVTVDISAGPFGLAGAAEVYTKFEAQSRLNGTMLEYMTSWGGIQAQFAGQVYAGIPSDPTWSVVVGFPPQNIIDGASTPWAPFYDLSQP